MTTECKPKQLEFHDLGRREVVGKFDGGRLTSDAGGILLREAEHRTRILHRLARCFSDFRSPKLIEHTVESLIKQRVFGLALGYEDLNDHDRLRHDPLWAVLGEKTEPSGSKRHRQQDRGKALAGKSTLNRLELTPALADEKSRYKKIVADGGAMDELLVDIFLESYEQPPAEIILDVDATDDPLHGAQEGRFFHGYYRHYCYLPLYIFCGAHLLAARLRTSDQDGAAGTVDELSRIIAQIRQRFPNVQIIVRGDSGFCRDDLLSWCEANQVDYIIGLARNPRLQKILAPAMTQAQWLYQASEQSARVFTAFRYRTLKSWSCERRVIGKAEYLAKGENPRFIVTTLDGNPQTLYEDGYCARGDMENRIKEQQLALFADRTSTHTLRANQIRLYLSSFAYVLMQALREHGLKGTALANAQCDSIRLKLFKLGAKVTISVRKVWLSFSESYPYAGLFYEALERIRRIPQRC